MKILGFLFIFASPLFLLGATREVIILLDGRGAQETIGKPSRIYLMNKLQSALQEEEIPLLISTSLWENFLEKRASISQMSKIEGSPEEKAITTYEMITKKLNTLFQEFQETGFDPIQS